MGILDFIVDFLKGGKHARRIENRVPGGREHEHRVLHPISAVCEQALSDFGGIRVLAAACADERSRDTGTMPPDPICRESRALIAAAKKIGCFVEAKNVPGTRYTIRTGESEIRLVQKEMLYYKVKNPFAKLHLKRHSVEYVLFEHIVHNILFPDCRLELLGITEDLHEARVVLRQNAVRSESRPDDKQIAEYLNQMGLCPEGRYEFGNEFVFVTDVGQDGDNVLLDDDNAMRFIDPIIGFKPPLLPYLKDVLNLEGNVLTLVNKLYGVGAGGANIREK